MGEWKKVEAKRLLVEREKFAKHDMVSAGVCFSGKGKLHFVGENATVSAKYYVENLLPHLINDCKKLLLDHSFLARWGSRVHSQISPRMD